MTKKKPTKREVAFGIGRYFEWLAAGGAETVALGAMPGLPNRTSDPAVVDKAVAHMEERYAETDGPIARLRLRARVLELQASAERLRASANGESPAAFFVEHAGAWAEEQGIPYEAFRAEGVSARVLKEAGITRGG